MMCWPNGEDNMSSSPRTLVGAGMYGASAASKVGYTNESDGATPLYHVGIFSRAGSNCLLSLLNSLLTRRGRPLTDRLERCGGLFFDLASTLFFRGDRSRSGDPLEDNSSSAAASLSSGQIGSLPLFCLIGGVGGCSLVHFLPNLLSNEPAGHRFLVVDGQHGSTIQPSVWPVLPASSPYPDSSEGIGLQGTGLLDCWP